MINKLIVWGNIFLVLAFVPLCIGFLIDNDTLSLVLNVSALVFAIVAVAFYYYPLHLWVERMYFGYRKARLIKKMGISGSMHNRTGETSAEEFPTLTEIGVLEKHEPWPDFHNH
ncbi:MAG: hypothetical protein KBB91_01265 [Candidatus Pacebacteria bacterium]|nr:hypothetical protein [Candidatus Paceibacterota bacterium]MBP9701005.1 hypothetical protein [Candidatus Paceibacterota bacterium]